MNISEIASLIAAVAFAVLVIALAMPLWKLAQVFEALRKSVADVGESANETVKEVSKTVSAANTQIEKIDVVTTSASQVAQDISAISTLTSAMVAKPLLKIAAFSKTTRSFIRKEGK